MLNVMRRGANSLVVKILLGLIALSFVVWGVGDDISRPSQVPLVKADRWSVTTHEFSQAYEDEYQRLQQQFGGALDKKTAEMFGLKQRALIQLIDQRLLQEAAHQLRLTISPDVIRRSIAENPLFQINGTFDKNRYELLLRNNRLSPREYEAKLTNDLLLNQLRQVVGLFPFSPEILVKDSFELTRETREIQTLALHSADLEKEINPTDEILQTYLTTHQDQFMTPVQVKVRHVLLSADSVRKEVTASDEEILAFYDENRDRYLQPETREARHILVKVTDKNGDDTARAKIEAARQRIQAGEAFADVAQAVSEDISAAQGGSLGTFGRGMMVGPFEDVVFSLPQQQLSEPVKTPFGYHLILVDQIHPEKTLPLAEVKEQIRPLIVEKKAASIVYERSITLEDQLYASGDLQGVASDLDLHYRETDFFSPSDQDKLVGIEKEKAFQDAAFSTPKGEISPVIELSDNRFFSLEVVDRQDPQPQILNNAREPILAAYRREKAKEMAGKILQEAKDRLAKGEPWETVAQHHAKIVNQTSAPFEREGTGPNLPSSPVRAVAFKLTLDKPDYQDLIVEREGFVLVRLLKIIPADPKTYETEAPTLRENLQRSLGFEQLEAYLNGLRGRADIRINQALLNKL